MVYIEGKVDFVARGIAPIMCELGQFPSAYWLRRVQLQHHMKSPNTKSTNSSVMLATKVFFSRRRFGVLAAVVNQLVFVKLNPRRPAYWYRQSSNASPPARERA
jgi:hypothetical protein